MIDVGILVLAEAAGFGAGALLPRARRALHAVPLSAGLAGLAAASAAGAMLTRASPSGVVVADCLGRAALGAGVVLLASTARPRGLLVSSVIAVVVSRGTSWQLLAVAITGLMVGGVLAPRRPRLVVALAGGALLQVVLHLQWPYRPGATAVVAALVLAPTAISGAADLHPVARRRLARTAAAGGLLGIFAFLALAVAAVEVRGSLEEGSSLLARGAQGLGAATPGDLDSRHLAASARAFGHARGILGNWLLRPVAVVPIVAQHWRAIHAAAITGDELARAGLQAARAPELGSIALEDGQVPLDRLAALGPPVTDLAARLGAGAARLRAAQSPWLVPALDRRLRREGARVARAERPAAAAAQAIPELPEILGAHEPRRYFLAVQTPAEERATGGFIGNFGEIGADRGRLSLTRFGRIQELIASAPRTLVGPPDYVARYARFHSPPDWRNVNVSPDFPTVAQVIAGLYPQSGGDAIDGVIAIDPAGLANLLEALGPVSVPAWPEALTADNAARILLRDQYERFETPERVDFLGAVAQEGGRGRDRGRRRPARP